MASVGIQIPCARSLFLGFARHYDSGNYVFEAETVTAHSHQVLHLGICLGQTLAQAAGQGVNGLL